MPENKKQQVILEKMMAINELIEQNKSREEEKVGTINYYKDFNFQGSNLAETDIFVAKVENKKDNTNTYEIYSGRTNSLIATVDEQGKLHFMPEYIESLKQIDPRLAEMLNLEDLDFELPQELEKDDNFCPSCGELTPHGYLSLKDNKLRYKEENIGSLFTLTVIIIISFITITLISGKDMFRPYIELQKEISSLKYGYKVSIMNTNNKYTNVTLSTKEEAINLIKQDITKQSWKCKRNINVSLIEKEISESYNIPSVSLCDVDEDVSNKIKEVITATYQLFPNIKGYLTNITITNAPSNEDYIAYFNPTNTFVNNNLDIKEYNKVNKTEILLNSYYFLNKDILSKGLK